MDKPSLFDRLFGNENSLRKSSFGGCYMTLLLVWPILSLGTVFFFDEPIHSTLDEVGRWGMVLIIVLYPIYLNPLFELARSLVNRYHSAWLYLIVPLLPLSLFFLFASFH